MNFNDETKFKKLTIFSGFAKQGTAITDLVSYEASEGYYISSEGEVWSTKTSEPRKLGGLDRGYRVCKLRLKDGNPRNVGIHRLVATCWVEGFNPEEGKIIVNHIDENKQNNHPSNLEWCTQKYNSTCGTVLARVSQLSKEYWKNVENRERKSQSVKATWKSPEYKEKMSQSAKEYWKNPEPRENISQANSKPVALFYSDGVIYKTFDSCTEASSYARVHLSTMTKWVKKRKPSKCGKYYWDYCN